MQSFQQRSEQWPHNETYYSRHLSQPRYFKPVAKSLPDYADIVVIGAGFAGLNTALGLLEKGAGRVVVLDASAVASGASGRNGGFIMSGFSRSADWLIKTLGISRARVLYQQSLQAQALVKERIRRYQIDCDLVEQGILLANRFRCSGVIKKYLSTINRLDANWLYLSPSEVRSYVKSDRYTDGLYELSGATCQPLAYAAGLARQVELLGGHIIEHCPVVGINRECQAARSQWCITVKQPDTSRQIRCSSVVIACGGLHMDILGGQGLKVSRVNKAVLPITTFIGVTEPHEALDQLLPSRTAIYDNRFAFDYFRKLPDKRLLWGGRISIASPDSHRIKVWLKSDICKVFPRLSNCTIDYAWGGYMGYFRHQMPVVEALADRCWLINGFGGHGLAQTTLAAEILIKAMGHDGHIDFPAAVTNRQPLAFGQPNAFGQFGLLAAQLTYWQHQLRDFLRL